MKLDVLFTVYFPYKKEIEGTLSKENISFEYSETAFIGWLYIGLVDVDRVMELVIENKWQDGMDEKFKAFAAPRGTSVG